MSGFVGILNLDGAPVDGSLLCDMTRFLAFRGPDGQGTQMLKNRRIRSRAAQHHRRLS